MGVLWRNRGSRPEAVLTYGEWKRAAVYAKSRRSETFRFSRENKRREIPENDGRGGSPCGGTEAARESAEEPRGGDGLTDANGHVAAKSKEGHRDAAAQHLTEGLVKTKGAKGDPRRDVQHQHPRGGEAGEVKEELRDNAHPSAREKYPQIGKKTLHFALYLLPCSFDADKMSHARNGAALLKLPGVHQCPRAHGQHTRKLPPLKAREEHGGKE